MNRKFEPYLPAENAANDEHSTLPSSNMFWVLPGIFGQLYRAYSYFIDVLKLYQSLWCLLGLPSFHTFRWGAKTRRQIRRNRSQNPCPDIDPHPLRLHLAWFATALISCAVHV